jgi:DNA-binding transcriptional LysR family regulator
MELRDIEYFAVVAEHGHLGRAAEALGLSTPALSKSLRRLEKEMLAKLVTRTPKGVELTPEGSALLAHVRPLRLSLHDIAREIADLNQGRAGHLRLGTSTGSADCLLPAAFSALLSDAPKVTVSITVGVNPVLVPALRNGQLDLLVITLGNLPYEGIAQEYLYEDEFVIYASADHRLAKRRSADVADLAKEGWALPVLDGVPGLWLHRVFEDHGLPPPRVNLVGGQMQIRLEAIGSSSLLGIAPRRSVREAASRLHLTEIPVKGMKWSRQVGVGYRKDAYLSPVTRRFIEILKRTAKEVAPGKP